MPAGRPKKTLDDLPKDWKEKTLALAAEGGSDVEIRVQCMDCIAHETWTRLLEEEPEFFETIKKAEALCHDWWKKQGRINLKDKEFSTSLWFINMKNRFGWKDKIDHTSNNKTISMPILQSEENL